MDKLTEMTHDDPLAPARGCVNAVLFSLAILLVVYGIIELIKVVAK